MKSPLMQVALWLFSLFIPLSTVAGDSYQLCRHANKIFTNATFITLNPDQPLAQSVAVRHHRIVAAGREKLIMTHCRDQNTRIIDMKGATVIPGFIDTNSQFALYGWLANHAVDLSTTNAFQRENWQPVKTTDEFLTALKNNVKTSEPWLIINGYDHARIKGEALNRTMLDKISAEKPILVLYSTGQKALLNQAAINKITELEIQQSIPVQSDGIVQDDALQAVIVALIPPQALRQAIQSAAARYAAQGYTTVTETRANQSWLNTYNQLTARSDFPVDVILSPDNIADSKRFALSEKDNPRLHSGPVILTIDGAIRDFNAYLNSPYFQESSDHAPAWRGQPHRHPQALEAVFLNACETKTPLALNCNGDAAIDMALNLIQKIQQRQNDPSFKPILKNAHIARQDQLHRMNLLGVKVDWFPNHVYYWGQSMCHEYLGPKRALKDSPLATARNILGTTSLHADSPATPPSPLQIIANSHSRQVQTWNYPISQRCPQYFSAAEKISVEDALRALTIDAARLYRLEGDKGSLKPGKLADMTVLNKNPLKGNNIAAIKILGTISRGRLHLKTTTENDTPTHDKP
ncbi:amidohydrolase [Legionella spiritensis]|uniref:amidohydrolase n=1 Tax=Legionella spiritensis TaxID=452 RepID=UPI000F6C96AA|nr:amidohydrolase family protein [Legionella spiritensis]VEG91386.1 N-substituted formamide deformylase precursor [Legionella spiritensis]